MFGTTSNQTISVMENETLSVFTLCSLLHLCKQPEHKEMSDYVGMSETEIRKIHPNAVTNEGKENVYLEIRLPEATLTCVLNKLRICIQCELFDDGDESGVKLKPLSAFTTKN